MRAVSSAGGGTVCDNMMLTFCFVSFLQNDKIIFVV